MSDLYDHGGEGDTPAFLYLVSAALGLNDPLSPTQGSWGSRFKGMGEEFPENYFHTCLDMKANAKKQRITVPKDLGNKEIHVILEVIDHGTPNLTTYRRVIIRAE